MIMVDFPIPVLDELLFSDSADAVGCSDDDDVAAAEDEAGTVDVRVMFSRLAAGELVEAAAAGLGLA